MPIVQDQDLQKKSKINLCINICVCAIGIQTKCYAPEGKTQVCSIYNRTTFG
ncbi:MAG: hypothetical protein RIS47_272 [Bacteroidota bacterium]|jgi:hypothetical protein